MPLSLYPDTPPVLNISTQAGFYFQGSKAVTLFYRVEPVRTHLVCQELHQHGSLVVARNRQWRAGPWPRPHPDFNHNPVGTSILVNLTPWSTDSWAADLSSVCDLKCQTFTAGWPLTPPVDKFASVHRSPIDSGFVTLVPVWQIIIQM